MLLLSAVVNVVGGGDLRILSLDNNGGGQNWVLITTTTTRDEVSLRSDQSTQGEGERSGDTAAADKNSWKDR